MWGGEKQPKTERTSRSWRNKNFFAVFHEFIGKDGEKHSVLGTTLSTNVDQELF